MKMYGKTEKGITLISLVITIIVLLILAGIAIVALSGENGILTRASEAKKATQIAEIKEKVQIDILEKQAENSGKLTKLQLKEILNKYFTDVPDEISDNIENLSLISKEEFGKHEIKVSEIWNGRLEDELSEEQAMSYIGYYADVDKDGTVDGVIYADLEKGGTGNYYEIPVVSGTKKYYVSQTNYEGPFGTKDVLSSEGGGNERFYIMAISDISNNSYYWYYNAMENKIEYDTAKTLASADFGTGKNNTNTMIQKWTTESYGDQNGASRGILDMWDPLSKMELNNWFVPSIGEWLAFANNLDIRVNDRETFGLKDGYWSSSLDPTKLTGTTHCKSVYWLNIGRYGDVVDRRSSGNDQNNYIRLSTMF